MPPLPSRRPALLLLAVLAGSALAGCGSGGDEEGQAPPDAAEATPVDGPVIFVDRAAEFGIDAVALAGNLDKRHLPESFGSGIAIADYDNDGDLDIYLGTNQTRDDWRAGRGTQPNALYRNDGDGRYTDVAAEAGVDLRAWTNATYFVDYDNDGDKDLFLLCWGTNVLYRNEGDGSFTDVSAEAGVAGPPVWNSSAAFGDLDNDGDLDLYITGYVEFDFAEEERLDRRVHWRGLEVWIGPRGLAGLPDMLYRNNGDGSFTDVTVEAGLDTSHDPLYGLGVVMADFDEDGDLDIYVANDSVPNNLWRNDGGLKFTGVATRAGVATNEEARDQAGMGTDAADYDGDGRIDLMVTNFSHDYNTVYRNLGELLFTDVTFAVKLSDAWTDLAWGVRFLDYDNDGWLDLVIANGHVYPEVDDVEGFGTSFKQTNSLYRNTGDGSFVNVSASAGPGFRKAEGSRALAVADLDRDGDLDIVINDLDLPPEVLINEGGNAGNFIAVTLVGTKSNRDAVGARLELTVGDRTLVREVNPYGSFQSQSAYEVHFGLGQASEAERLVIRWPSGSVDEISGLQAGSFLTVEEGESRRN